MSQDSIAFGDEQETFASITSVVLNVAVVLSIALMLSLVTVLLHNPIAQVVLVLAGALLIGLFTHRLTDGLILGVAVAMLMLKPIITAATITNHPQVAAAFSLLAITVVVPELIRLTNQTRRTIHTALDTIVLAMPLAWMIWLTIIQQFIVAGVDPGVAWALGSVDFALMMQGLTVVIHRPQGGIWRPIWAGAMAAIVLIDMGTATVLMRQIDLLPFLAMCSGVVATMAYLAMSVYNREGDAPQRDEEMIVWRQWFVTIICICVVLVSQLITRRGAEPISDLIVAAITIIIGLRAITNTRRVHTIRLRRIELEAEIVNMRRIDRLTKLPTRRAFLNDLLEALEGYGPMTLLLLDLDQFRRINDALGPQSGDMVLLDVANKIREWNREAYNDAFMTGRIGPNTFAVAFVNAKEDEEDRAQRALGPFAKAYEQRLITKDANSIAHELLGLIRGEYNLRGLGRIQLGCSIGVYESQPVDSVDVVFQKAERALYRAKSIGRGTISTETPEQNQAPFPMTSDELRMAIRRNSVNFETRPIVDLASDQVIALQARVMLDTRHKITWGDLQQAAHDYGITRELNRWLLKRSCQVVLAQRTPVWMLVQARQLFDQYFVGDLHDFLTAYRIPRDQLTLCIKDRFSFTQGPNQINVLNKLRSLGVRLTLEEFGTGACSFSHIRELPVQTLSLDGQFVRDAQEDTKSRALVESVIIAASGMDVSVLATEVDHTDSRRIVLDVGCTLANGPLWGDWQVRMRL